MLIDTLEAIAVAVAAYEYHGKKYIKNQSYDPQTDGTVWTNKDILRAYYQADYYSVDDLSKRPPLMKVTETHKEQAVLIRDYTKKNLFKALSYDAKSSDYPPYDVSMFQKLNQETITISDFGFVASSPYYYDNNTQRDKVRNIVESSNSKHVGVIGGKVVLDNFTVLRSSYSKNYNGYVVSGICDGNLFLFFTSKNVADLRTFDVISIDGRVKAHILEKEKHPLTKLNYVHIKKGDKEYEEQLAVRTDIFSEVL